MDLMTRRRAMLAAAAASGEHGILELPWITGHETVTIGANAFSNMAQIKTFFDAYAPYCIVVLKTAPGTANQPVALFNSGESALRFRNGTISNSGLTASYDGALVEGTQYDVYYY